VASTNDLSKFEDGVNALFYWFNWLERMNAYKIPFIQREQSTEITANRI
jgi:hypothetical protein